MHAQYEQEWKTFLDEVLASEERHYLWLRSLSYLEYIGYRKMVKALGYDKVNRGVYRHLTDEIQHSFMLRELAEKNFGRCSKEDSFDRKYQEIAEHYFQKIDAEIHGRFAASLPKKTLLCYLLTSYIVENARCKSTPTISIAPARPVQIHRPKIIKDERTPRYRGKMAS
jgi:hypothetical protein